MSFLTNVLNAFTDKREMKEPEIYKEFNETSHMIANLTRLIENKEPNIDLKKVRKTFETIYHRANRRKKCPI
ncbi:hypothetical protein [Bacillus coahuilensis]|uniref:hypothetical protein n=1 Tax=Bacillus coahuilensis TaxID=408580 RepID=UPI0001851245|nr:hypothetical protein [Bacillus coahuilensis]